MNRGDAIVRGTPNRRLFLKTAAAVAAAPAVISRAGSAPGRLNILFAITDDQSWLHAGAYGTKAVNTPAFDRCAEEGALFKHAFTACPSCTPSRGALLTGRPMWRLGPGGTLYGTLPAELDVFPLMLEEAGYFVGSTGKTWGPGQLKPGGRNRPPTGQPFDKIKTDPPQQHMSRTDYAANFEAFLDARPDGQPFCFWFGAVEPHRKYQRGAGLAAGKNLSEAPVPPFLPDAPGIRGDILDYFTEIEHADRHLERMLDALEKRGELDNTLVIATSDNGMPFPRAKANLYDWGTRMPLAVRCPALTSGGRVLEDFVTHDCIAPSILEAAGVKVPEGMLGTSWLPPLTASGSGRIDPARDFAVTAFERHTLCRPGNAGYPMRAIRTADYLYIRNYEPDRWPAGSPDVDSVHQGSYGDIDNGASKEYMMEHRDDPATARLFELGFQKRPAEELYDAKNDPGQLNNLTGNGEHGEALNALRRRMENHLRDTGDPRVRGENPWDDYLYYHPSAMKSGG